MKIIALVAVAVLMSGCVTSEPPNDIIRVGSCQWIRETGDWNYNHYGKCDSPEHKQWIIYNQENKH